MTATPSDPQSAGDASAEHNPIALTFEDKLQLFWRRHSTLVIAVCVAVALAIIGVGAWDYVEAQREADVEKAYAAASTPESLKTFADAHPEHTLAGAAYLRMADDAFAAGKTADAQANYEKAAGIFKDGPLAARTKLGLAVTKVVGAKTAEGTAELKQLADDGNQFKGIRTEAAYHLASLAAEAGNGAEVLKYSDLLMQIDPSSPWTQRAFALRASLPPGAIPSEPKKDASAAPNASTIQFAPAGK